MRIFVLIINYIFLTIWILALLSLVWEFSLDVLLWAILFLLLSIPNLIYAHITKPVDKEKEDLKKQIEELNKKLENTNI